MVETVWTLVGIAVLIVLMPRVWKVFKQAHNAMTGSESEAPAFARVSARIRWKRAVLAFLGVGSLAVVVAAGFEFHKEREKQIKRDREREADEKRRRRVGSMWQAALEEARHDFPNLSTSEQNSIACRLVVGPSYAAAGRKRLGPDMYSLPCREDEHTGYRNVLAAAYLDLDDQLALQRRSEDPEFAAAQNRDWDRKAEKLLEDSRSGCRRTNYRTRNDFWVDSPECLQVRREYERPDRLAELRQFVIDKEFRARRTAALEDRYCREILDSYSCPPKITGTLDGSFKGASFSILLADLRQAVEK